MDTDLQDAIWNRAAMANGGPAARRGDLALSAALSFHNMVMNGGLDHALDVLTPADLVAAADGYRYLLMNEVVDLVHDAQAAASTEDDDTFEELDDRYDDLIPDDQTLIDRFVAVLEQHPEDFADLT